MNPDSPANPSEEPSTPAKETAAPVTETAAPTPESPAPATETAPPPSEESATPAATKKSPKINFPPKPVLASTAPETPSYPIESANLAPEEGVQPPPIPATATETSHSDSDPKTCSLCCPLVILAFLIALLAFGMQLWIFLF